ncbi:hypothetical protein CLV63_10224 [Murinocardiopsis flavida]|uniref:Uncharacterized protein n=1 Tax=Murinocardiopsis flavida TaxID=645275 RepID=A0A2P8DRQ9_9ACTN|nr:hypothetical protein [Murinocardiopsis flavida]PSK99897.1 hypothetical protein CLV63_10224 [Murinocardiopsis flavida]
MPPVGLIIALILLVVAAAVVAIVLAARAAHARRVAELQAWAQRNGFRYEGDRPDLVSEHAASSGRRSVRHVLSGNRHGYSTLIYELSVRTGHGDSARTRNYQVVALDLPSPTPTLSLSREGFGSRVLEFLGVHDLRVGDPVFDETYRVETSDAGFAMAVLTPDMRSWLMTAMEYLDSGISFTGRRLVSSRHTSGSRSDPDAGLVTADYLAGTLARVPAQVWRAAPPPGMYPGPQW